MRSRLQGRMLCVKYLMFVLNLLVWLSGLGLIVVGGLGELLYGDFSEMTKTGFTSASALLILIGCFVAVVGFAGCYGSVRESHGTLKLFSYLLAILVIVEVSLGAWLYFSHIKVFTMAQGFLSQIISKYEMDQDVEQLIDKVQEKYKCCGSTKYSDWFNSNWNKNKQNSSSNVWINNVPHSCCLANTTQFPTCGGNIATKLKPAYKYVYTRGCFGSIHGYLMHHISIVITVGVLLVTLQVLASFLACCLCRAVKAEFEREFGDHVNLVL